MKRVFFVLFLGATAMLLPGLAHAQCAPDEILVQAEPGFNPDAVVYRVYGDISLSPGEENVFRVTNTGGSQQCMAFPDLPVGGTLTVDASFAPKHAKDGGSSVSCSRSYTVVSPGSIGCGPIEVAYQVYNNTCVIVCN